MTEELDSQSGELAGNVGLRPGTRLGKYEIIEKTGVGGQAIVYKAQDTLLDRRVAIKQISTHLAGDQRFVDRFRREAKMLARLGGEQSNIVNVYDVIEDASGFFIVMEFFEGHTLRTILDHQHHAIPVQAALEILWHIANGLRAAHRQGIVHRDIKPANIIVNRRYRAKITDFGVAAEKGGQESMTLGTTKYMAPEVFEGGTVEAGVDVYSLGFIAYEMLTGREYFNDLFHDVVRDPHSENLRWMKWHSNPELKGPPLAEINGNVPQELSGIIARMVEKDPHVRYRSIEDVMADLKMAFGPRKRKGGRKGAVDSARQRASAGAASSAQFQDAAQQPPIDSGVEGEGPLELPPEGAAPAEELPTVEVPRTKWSPRAKIIVAASAVGVALIAGVVLAGWMLSAQGRAKNEAQESFDKAMEVYSGAQQAYSAGDVSTAQEQFAKAVAGFNAIVARHPKLAITKESKARAYLAEAQVAMLEGRWADAEDVSEKARRMPGALPGDEVSDFKNGLAMRQTSLAQTEALTKLIDKAEQDVANGVSVSTTVLNQHKTELDKLLGQSMRPPKDIEQDALKLSARLAELVKRNQYEQLMREASQAIQQNRLDDAADKYRQARQTLATEEVDQAITDLASLRRSSQLRAQAAALLAQAADEPDTKQMRQALDLLQQAQTARPDDRLAQQIRDLSGQAAYKDARAAELANALALARKYYAEAESFGHPDAAAALTRLASSEARAGRIAEGDRLLGQGEFDQAIAKYETAREIRDGADVQAKLTDARYRRALDAGGKARRRQDWKASVKAYEQARQEKIDDAAVNKRIDGLVDLINQERKYYDNINDAKKLVGAGKYDDAVKSYDAAIALAPGLQVDVDDAKKRRDMALYLKYVQLGKEQHGKDNLQLALANYKTAESYLKTAEVAELIAKLEAEIKAMGGG